MKTSLLTRLKPDELFSGRIRAAKAVLRGKRWRKQFLARNPAWNNDADLAFLNRVYVGRAKDVNVTRELEAIARAIDPAFTPTVL